MRSFQYSSKSVHFSENPPSEDKLEAKLLSPLDRKASAAMELLPELLLRRLRLRLLGRLLPLLLWDCCSVGVCNSSLNLAVAVTLVPEAPWLLSTVMCGSRKTEVPLRLFWRLFGGSECWSAALGTDFGSTLWICNGK